MPVAVEGPGPPGPRRFDSTSEFGCPALVARRRPVGPGLRIGWLASGGGGASPFPPASAPARAGDPMSQTRGSLASCRLKIQTPTLNLKLQIAGGGAPCTGTCQCAVACGTVDLTGSCESSPQVSCNAACLPVPVCRLPVRSNGSRQVSARDPARPLRSRSR
jgi:hypothetical protein